jgi:hypothetical protein
MNNVFLHTGHIGDIIAFLPAMKALGGGKIVIKNHNEHWTPMKGERYDSIKPLLEKQSYITEVEYNDHPNDITIDNTDFRKYHQYFGISLIEAQAKNLGVIPKYDAWIDAEADHRTKGKVICCRSTRYRNYLFPWHKIIKKLGDDAIFCGTKDEYDVFQKENRISIPYFKTMNMLHLANAIKGSRLFIGNQSSPFWLAAGLNHPCIQETCQFVQDSIVPYKRAVYCDDGNINLDLLK